MSMRAWLEARTKVREGSTSSVVGRALRVEGARREASMQAHVEGEGSTGGRNLCGPGDSGRRRCHARQGGGAASPRGPGDRMEGVYAPPSISRPFLGFSQIPWGPTPSCRR